MSWKCKCGLLNNGLNESCAASKTYTNEEHYQISRNSLDYLRVNVALREEKIMTDREELFAKYYNKGKLLVKDMNDSELREHRDSLWHIATEAKATLLAADDEVKERDSKKRSKDKEWLTTVEHDKATSDALNNIKTRTARMSKIDKMREQLLATGIDEDTVKEMIRTMEKRATEKNLKTVTFNKPSVETAVAIVKPKNDSDNIPFDASKLSFGK